MKNFIKISSSQLPTEFGQFTIYVYKDLLTNIEHTALVMGNIATGEDILTRIHSECLTGDVFSSRRCDCGDQLKLAQQKIAKAGAGVIIYLRGHEGRGIGLANKIRAYHLQDNGLDTVEANLALGLPIDSRSFVVASKILDDLGVQSVKLLTNNPEKFNSLKENGIDINLKVPLLIKPNIFNANYLATKKLKLGHSI